MLVQRLILYNRGSEFVTVPYRTVPYRTVPYRVRTVPYRVRTVQYRVLSVFHFFYRTVFYRERDRYRTVFFV